MKQKTVKKLISIIMTLTLLCTGVFAQLIVSAAPSENGLDTARQIAAEGIVLLKNSDKTDKGLPMAKGTKLTVFGTNQLNAFLGGGGTGGVAATDPVKFLPALRSEGFVLNEDLINTYQTWWDEGGKDLDYRPVDFGGGSLGEYTTGSVARAEMDVTDQMLKDAKAFSDTALVIIGRSGSEGLDLGNDDLALYPNEEKLIDQVATTFDNVIVLLNICNAVSLGFLDKYESITAAAIIWAPGEVGMTSVAKMLTGEVNPSGKLVDTFAYSVYDHPSTVNFGSFVDPKSVTYYERDGEPIMWKIDEKGDFIREEVSGGRNPVYKYFEAEEGEPGKARPEFWQYYVEYEEDIYVGYRYFETFADAKDKVQFEFGYGMSYTTFDVTPLEYSVDKDAFRYGSITLKALVKNTGDYAGKEVVQVYYGAPDGKLEKPAKELVAYQKTDLLQPGESQIVSITFDIEEMASYSEADACYILEKGDYNIYLGTSVRQLVGTSTYNLAADQLIRTDAFTGTAYENRFDNMSVGKDKDHDGTPDGIDKLSKKNPAGTWPTEAEADKSIPQDSGWAGDGINRQTSGHTGGRFTEPGAMPTVTNNVMMGGETAEIQLIDVYKDPSKMDAFLAQFTDEELVLLQLSGGFHTLGSERLGVPFTISQDGPACVKADKSLGGTAGTSFPIGTMVACTWNPDLAYQMGVDAGKEAKENFTDCWYAPGANTHRNPRGGRNFEYFTEDPMLGAITLASMVKGAQENGLTTAIKHYAGNEQETNRNGTETWMSERVYREIYLKQFEMAVKIGSMSAMSAFNRLGDVWAGGHYGLMTGITRDEWGFRGYIVSDMWATPYMRCVDATYAGNDTMLGRSINAQGLADFSYEFGQNPEEIRAALENCARNIMNFVMQTHKFSAILGSSENIGTSITNFAFPFVGTLSTALNRTQLEELIAASEAIDLSGYTAGSVKHFSDVLAQAKALLTDASATQADLDAMVTKLQLAKSALVKDGKDGQDGKDGKDGQDGKDNTSTDKKDQGKGTGTSPKTGDYSMVPLAIMIAVAGMGIAIISRKKIKLFNR